MAFRPIGTAATTRPCDFEQLVIASSVAIPTQGISREFFSPRAVAIPILMPVKLPGPIETATLPISLREIELRPSISAMFGNRSSERETPPLPIQQSISLPPDHKLILPPAIADSIDRIISFWAKSGIPASLYTIE